MKKWCLMAVLIMALALPACSAEGNEMYLAAVEDAKACEANEICELFELADGENLLVSWNNFPDTFSVGENYTATAELELWCVSYQELVDWFELNADGVSDWTLRLEQLIGLPEGFGYTHFTAFAVEPEDMIRPAYQPDAQKQLTADVLDGSALGEHAAWFAGNEQWSYVDSAWPWTRLGYTYDWAEGREKGLSEFLILTGAEVEVEWCVTTDELIAMMEKDI